MSEENDKPLSADEKVLAGASVAIGFCIAISHDLFDGIAAGLFAYILVAPLLHLVRIFK